MRVKKIEIIPLVLLYFNIILIFKLMSKCYLINDMDYLYVTILFLISIVALSVYRFVLDRVSYKLLAIAALAILIVISFFIRGGSLRDIYYSNYVFNFNAILEAVNSGANTYFASYQPFILILLPAVLVIITFFYYRGFRNFILLVDLAFFIILWFIGYSNIIIASLWDIVFLLLITYSVHLLYRDIQKNEAKGIRVGKMGLTPIMYILMMALILTYITQIMPQTYKGKYDAFVNSYLNNVFANSGSSSKNILDLKALYDLTLSGFNNNDTKLGGPITPDGSLVFKVQSHNLYYLRGVTKDYYDGSTWKQTSSDYGDFKGIVEEDERQKILDYINSSGLNINKDLLNSISKSSITVFPVDFKTSTLFSPMGVISINAAGSVLSDQGNTFLNAKGTSVDYNYDVSFLESPLSTENFPDLYKEKTSGNIINYDSIADSVNYKDYEKYLQVPDNVSQNIRQLVYSITADCKTNDEKVLKIQQFLSANYPYSLKVSTVPDNKEFLDYFLFTEKKGYCTYFATATTIFCRIAGIPARYVEGFHMADYMSDGLNLVTNNMAHAWTEVLVSPEDDLWATVDCAPNAYSSITKPNTHPGTAIDPNNPGNKPKPKPDANNSANSNNGDKKKGSFFIIDKKALIADSAIALFILGIILRILFIERKKRKIIRSRSIVPIYKHSLKRLKLIKIQKKKEDTEFEFANKLENKELRSRLMELIPDIYRESYGGRSAEENKIDKKAFYRFIEKYIRDRQNIFKYLLAKFFIY